MKSEHVKKAAAYAGKSLAELARETSQKTPTNLGNKLKRGTLKDDELEELAQAMGAKYRVYFEFPDGTKIGSWKES